MDAIGLLGAGAAAIVTGIVSLAIVARMGKRAEMTEVFPILPARNVSEAIRVYVDRLGFEAMFTDRDVDPQYAGVRRGGVRLHFQFQFDKDFEAGTAGQCRLRLMVDDPDAPFGEYRTRGCSTSGPSSGIRRGRHASSGSLIRTATAYGPAGSLSLRQKWRRRRRGVERAEVWDQTSTAGR